jgi:hypothetical protein
MTTSLARRAAARRLALMLEAAPSASGVLLERATMIGESEDHLRASEVLDWCRLEAGSFFETAPAFLIDRPWVHDTGAATRLKV